MYLPYSLYSTIPLILLKHTMVKYKESDNRIFPVFVDIEFGWEFQKMCQLSPRLSPRLSPKIWTKVTAMNENFDKPYFFCTSFCI